MLVAPNLVIFWLSRGAVMPLASHAVSLLLAPQSFGAGLSALLRLQKLDFFVTPKAVERRRLRLHVSTLAWTALVFVALTAGVIYRSVNPWPDPQARAFFFWNAAATGLFMMLLWIAMIPCIERPRYRKAERYAHRGRVILRHEGIERDCVLYDLSVTGARVASSSEVPLGDGYTVSLSASLEVPARVVRRRGALEVGVEFLASAEQEVRLIHLILCSPAYVPQPERWSWWRFCAVVARRSIGVRAAASKYAGVD
jgi:cellulose synthase (UDP-forming)